MAQQFQVLKCCFCSLFQVQQVKKSKKWNCKVCNEKQSILKVFGQGSGSDCRRHVQKLNLMQGEIQQAPMNLLRDIEEPIKTNYQNIVIFKEELGQQEEKKEKFSRWAKYLDKKCEEQDEEVLQTDEEPCCSSKGTIVKHTRKRKNSDAQRYEKSSLTGFADDVKRFEENSHDSVTASTKCGDVICKNVLTPDSKNKDPCSRVTGLSKWDKYLLLGKGCSSGATAATRQETLVKTSAVAGENASAAPSINAHSWHCVSQQNVAISCEGTEVSTTHPIRSPSILTGKNKQPPSLPSAQLHERQWKRPSEQMSSTHSTSIAALSSSRTPFGSLFSTEDNFDDCI